MRKLRCGTQKTARIPFVNVRLAIKIGECHLWEKHEPRRAEKPKMSSGM